jgi:acyl carrier protein
MNSDLLQSYENKVRDQIVRIGSAIEEIELDARLQEDIGFDSLDLIEFVMAMEEIYDIEISEADACKWKTVDDVVQYLGNRCVGNRVKHAKAVRS